MHDTIELIWADEADHDVLADIMYDAVRHGPSRYTEKQRVTCVPKRRLWVQASLMAQPAFASMGFSVTEEQVVYIGDQSFERAEMEKPLD